MRPANFYTLEPSAARHHLKAIYAEGELTELATCNNYLQVRYAGGREVTL